MQVVERVEELGGQPDGHRTDEAEDGEQHEDDGDPPWQQTVDEVDERIDQHGDDGAGDHPSDGSMGGDEHVAEHERRDDGADEEDGGRRREAGSPDPRTTGSRLVDTGSGHDRHRSLGRTGCPGGRGRFGSLPAVADRALQRSDDVVFDMAGDRAVLLDASGTELITLNPVGSMVWNELDGVRDAAALAAALHDRFTGVGVDDLRDDIAAFLDELATLGLAVDAAG